MKHKVFTGACLIMLWAVAGRLASARAGGLPEPGLVIHGVVSNFPPSAVTGATLVWTNRHGLEQIITPAKWIIVNGQVFYVAHIPFETRSTGSSQALSASPNTFELPSSLASFTRDAGVNGQPLQFAVPTQTDYAFGPTERGRIDRVDLLASGAPDTFEQWIALFPSVPVNLRGPNDDPDGDGVSNHDEFIAGTDPNDAKSLFKMSSDIEPSSQGGLRITWSSATGKSYSVSRSVDLGAPPDQQFIVLDASVGSAGTTTSYTDNTATLPGPYFYRIQVNE